MKEPSKNTSEATYSKYLEKAQREIYYCFNCQAVDSGDIIWVQGDRISLLDHFTDLRIPQKYWDQLADDLYCRNCGTSHFGLGADVGLQTKFEKQLTQLEKTGRKVYEKQVKGLEDILTRFPFLALTNSFGRRLLKEIKGNKLNITQIEGTFFRARPVKHKKVLKSRDMSEAPFGKPPEGRFNHAGQSHLYLASEKELAQLEVAKRDCSICWQRWTIEPIDNVLDLTLDWDETSLSTSASLVALNLGNSLVRLDGNVKNWRPDYFITRFIMDCAKSLGYSGIKFNSARGFGFNVVLFYPKRVQAKKSKPVTSRFRLEKKEKRFKRPDIRVDLYE